LYTQPASVAAWSPVVSDGSAQKFEVDPPSRHQAG